MGLVVLLHGEERCVTSAPPSFPALLAAVQSAFRLPSSLSHADLEIHTTYFGRRTRVLETAWEDPAFVLENGAELEVVVREQGGRRNVKLQGRGTTDAGLAGASKLVEKMEGVQELWYNGEFRAGNDATAGLGLLKAADGAAVAPGSDRMLVDADPPIDPARLLSSPPPTPLRDQPSPFRSPSPTPLNLVCSSLHGSAALSPPLVARPLATPKRSPSHQPSASSSALTSPTHLLPLDRLIQAGTIVLPYHAISADALPQDAEDDWIRLTRTLLVPTGEAPVLEPVLQPQAPPQTPSQRRKGKGKATPASTPVKRKAKTSSLLDDVLALQSALLLRATAKTSEGNGVVLRIYLVPLDLPELREEKVWKTRRGKPASSTVLGVLGAIRVEAGEWGSGHSGEGEVRRLMDEEDKRSLLEIFLKLDSPEHEVDSYAELEDASDEIKQRLREALTEDPVGVKSTLYRHQRASLARMLAMELAPQLSVDPSYHAYDSLDSNASFYISVTGDVVSAPPKVQEPRGGILADAMGSGKTAISLALILSTLDHLPNLDATSSTLDGAPRSTPQILTEIYSSLAATNLSNPPQSSLTFPFEAYRVEQTALKHRIPPQFAGYESTAREIERYQVELDRQEYEDVNAPPPRLPTLRDICLHFLAARPHLIPRDVDPTPAGPLWWADRLQPYYFLHPSAAQLESRSGRGGNFSSKKMYVGRGTLIVVPSVLVAQWKVEINKHVEEGRLRVLVLKTSKDVFPPAFELARYDIVLMSTARFSDAADDLHSPVPKVHWLRLLVDEGHTLSGENRLRKFAEQLACGARWAITGTPSTNLRGSPGEDEGALFASDSDVGGDEQDFQRLGAIIGRFLRHPAFKKPDVWRGVVTVPFLEEQRGAARVARILRLVVRNQPDRLKMSYDLPPIHSHIVHLNFASAERKTYNALLALFNINSIDSQRTDEDYLFHSRNRKHLSEMTTNLLASSFFFASTDLPRRLREATKHASESLGKTRSESWSDEDRLAVHHGISIMQEALDDKEWWQVFEGIAVGMHVTEMDDELVNTFGGLRAANNSGGGRTLLPLGGLVTFRRDVAELRKPELAMWKDDEDLVEEVITFEKKRQFDSLQPHQPSQSPVKRKPKNAHAQLVPLPIDSSFRRIQIGASTSTKLNFVVEEVRRYPEEKFVVFSSSRPDMLFAALSEAFDVLRISHAIIAGSHHKGDRGATAAAFNSCSAKDRQVLLVDAKAGGRGLNLTGASRIIMLEPIWNPDLEMQAAKRCHRLGQTRKVDLSILVIADSFENALLKRRAQLTSRDFSSTKEPQGDLQLRELLQAAAYLEESDADATTSARMIPLLVDDPPFSPTASPAKSRKRPRDPKDVGSTPKRKKEVHLVEEQQ